MKIIDYQMTPIQRLKDNLNNNSFYMKRDDLFPFSFGGNKARKALLFYEEFIKKGADCIVTYGASSSNHCRIIANLAAAKQLPCYIISPAESNHPTTNRHLVELFGAKIIESFISDVSNTIDNLIKGLIKKGSTPYFIEGGGHGNLGTQAYVNAYKEIIEFEQRNQINFDYIFVTSGTGTTQAGLICGKEIYQGNHCIVGISNARKKPHGSTVVRESVDSYMSEYELNSIDNKEVMFIDDYVLGGYGTYNQEVLQTVKQIIVNEGIPLDLTYTGKAYWGMGEYVKKSNIANKNILFIHTGGTPLFFDKLEELYNE